MGKRFVDNGDGTITDTENNLMWKQTDSYQDTSKWVNWFDAHDYVRKVNIEKFAGYLDWRIPTLEEAESLYDEEFSTRDVDRIEIHIDAAFSPGGGFTTWTVEERPHNSAIAFYFRYGHANLNHKEDITKDSVRLVRTISSGEGE